MGRAVLVLEDCQGLTVTCQHGEGLELLQLSVWGHHQPPPAVQSSPRCPPNIQVCAEDLLSHKIPTFKWRDCLYLEILTASPYPRQGKFQKHGMILLVMTVRCERGNLIKFQTTISRQAEEWYHCGAGGTCGLSGASSVVTLYRASHCVASSSSAACRMAR